jgi:hypothetical protein
VQQTRAKEEGAWIQIEGIDVYGFSGDRIRSKDVYQKA